MCSTVSTFGLVSSNKDRYPGGISARLRDRPLAAARCHRFTDLCTARRSPCGDVATS